MLLAAAVLALAADAATAPRPWSTPPIASDQFESHPAFDPRTGDLWFVRSKPDFSGWRIKVSRCGADGWQAPVDAPFAVEEAAEADPWFDADGSTLWFISTRGSRDPKDLNIWRVARDTAGTWGTPEKLPDAINSDTTEWYPRPGRDGWLYFGSKRPGGIGGNDIWRARQDRHGAWTAENLGAAVNTPSDEFEAEEAPDGQSLLIMAADGLYRSARTTAGWGPKVKLGPEINRNAGEVGALQSPSGRSWLFARDLGAGRSGEILLAGAEEAWPPRCPR